MLIKERESAVSMKADIPDKQSPPTEYPKKSDVTSTVLHFNLEAVINGVFY